MRGIAAAVAALCALTLGAGPGSASAAEAAGKALKSPQVVHTAKGPTGYTVTFRYANPAAKRVQIKGEWLFARPSELARLSATPDNPVIEGQGLLPKDWKPGDFPLQKPNSTAPNFAVAEMTRGKNGVWTYSTPLPSGVFSYSFLVDCPATPVQGQPCRGISDPSNRPWNEKGATRVGQLAPNSQVYVPSDPAFGTVDYSWQGPAAGAKGRLKLEVYPSPGHVTPKDENNLVVYTPPNYDPARAKPYPTFWLSHGGGENEMGWSTQGDVANIMDNLIDSGQVEPMVVVMPNGSGYPNSTFNEAYDRDLIDRMIPFIEARYHVDHSAGRRAFSGLSMGGMLTNSFIINHPEAFQYYGVMSAGLPPANAELTPAQIAALKGKTLWIGGGWQDVIHAVGFSPGGTPTHLGPAREVSTFAKAGIPITTNYVYGGHEWFVWRQLLKDFLTHTAFLPHPYALWLEQPAK